MEQLVGKINGILWSNWLVYLLIVVGIGFTVSTRFVQFRTIKDMVRLVIKSDKNAEVGVSSFQAFAMSIAGRVGTGNIAGVATAIAMGGPGAIFWMWLIAFMGAATAFIECTLAQIYKEKIGDEFRGGPAYYIKNGLGNKWYAAIFAFATALAMGVLNNFVQANSITASFNNAFNIPPAYTGIALCLLLAVVIIGGVKRIAKFAEFVVPIMAIGYLGIALIVVLVNIKQLPGVIALIFKCAFNFEAAFGGVFGSAISWGVKRGLYSNEAGLGTAPQAAAAADAKHPVEQGLMQAFTVYIDTLFVCSATAFMILTTGKYNVVNPAGGFIVNNVPGIEYGPAYTQLAVETVFKGFGSAFVAISLMFFAFTSLLSNYYYGETNLVYLWGRNKALIWGLRAVFVITTFYGAIKTAGLAWALGDAGVGLMSWLNIISVILLGKIALKVFKDYELEKAKGIQPVFDPVKLGIKNAKVWEEKCKAKQYTM